MTAMRLTGGALPGGLADAGECDPTGNRVPHATAQSGCGARPRWLPTGGGATQTTTITWALRGHFAPFGMGAS